MRLIVITLLAAGSVGVAKIEEYVPEALASTAAAAPRAVASAVAATQKAELNECLNELGMSNKNPENYFLAVPVQLNNDNITDYLVIPSKRCGNFFGMHAIWFWLVRGNRNGSFSVVDSESVDAVSLLDTYTLGYRDISISYNRDHVTHRYNGR